MKNRDVLAVFNRGRISRLALARTDVARVALSADVQTNWVPRTLGSMMVRPGFGYIGAVRDDGADVPFIYSNDDTATLELSPYRMRVLIGGETLVTRPGVSASVANPDFTTDLASWASGDDAGASSVWIDGEMQLNGSGYDTSRRSQLITVTEPGETHALRIIVNRGPVVMRIGSTLGADDVFRQAVLRSGTHSIAFVPGGDFYIEFSSSLAYPVVIESCHIEASGTLELPTPWATAEDCKAVRWQQSADVVFCACAGHQQQRIERRPNNSWSIAKYEANDGPFLTENVSSIRMTPSALNGKITLTASRDVFQDGHVGALFRISSQGQIVRSSLSADLTFTNAIRVTGVEAGRIFKVTRSGTWSGTLSLQRSIGEEGSWATVSSYTTNGSYDYDDDLDNSIAYYRIGFEAGNYTSGTVDVELEFSAGSITGDVRIVGITDSKTATAIVLTALGGTTSTEVWSEGSWSDVQGWPTAVGLSEGRLWWAGQGRNYASVPDGLVNFDPETIGDSQPINRRIGEGSVNVANWMLPMQNLIVGTDGAEHSIRSTSFEEPVTPSNYNTKARTSKGSAPVPAVTADSIGYFVGRTTERVFELEYDAASYGYSTTDAMALVPEMGTESPIIRLGIQQTPDVRVHAIRANGTVAMLVRDPAEDVKCWIDIETDGFVEDVIILPGISEDKVFYRVRRVINGVTVRYREKWAHESECRGGAVNKMADSFVVGSGAVTGLAHLEGREVVVWADGADIGRYTVSGGAVAVSGAEWCAGLPYEARYKSAKLAGQTGLGLSLTQITRIDHVGLVLADTHAQGIQFGPSFDELDSLPMIEDGELVDPDYIWESYDKGMVEFPGDWDSDNRICLVGAAPRPCTVLAAALSIDREDKA